jgi:hypothetical protein
MQCGFGPKRVSVAPDHLRLLTILQKSAHDLRNDDHMDVLTPEYIKMYMPLQAGNVKAMLGELVAHRTDIDEGVDITIQNDDARRNVAGGEFRWTVSRAGAVFASTKSGYVVITVVHDKAGGAHELKPMYDRL